MRIYPLLQAFVLTVLVAMPSAGAMADAGLDDWRAQVARVRMLAENDIPAAYRDALLLQFSLPASANAADKARLLNLLARIEVYLGDTAEAERYAKEAFELALKNGDRAGQAEADLNNALNTVNQARFDAMSEAIKHSMDILAGVDRPDLLAEAMLRTSMMFRRFDRFDDSIEVAMQAMDIAKRSNDPLALVYAYQGMAIAYDFSGRQAEARDYYAKMRRAAQNNHSRLQEGDALIGLGSAMTSMGDVKSAERLIRDGNLLYRKAGGPFYLAHGLHMLAENLRHQGRLAEAQTAIDETIDIYEKRSNKVGLWWALNLRSSNSRALGRAAQAKADANRAYKLAREIGHFLYLSESVRMQAVIAAEARDFKSAYRLAAEATELAAKSARERASEHVLELTRRYENDSRQRQLAELTRSNEMHALQQRWLWTVLGGSVVLLVIAVLFLLHLRRSREEVRTLNIDLEQRVHKRTAELHQSRQSLAEAQRIAHVGSWELNLAVNKLKWSDEVFRIFEIDPQAFGATYEDFLAAVHPEDRNRVAEAYSRSLRKHEPFEIEHRLAFPDGRVKYVHERSETVFAADGKPLHSIGTVQDITERKLAEMALHENLEQITLLNRNLEDSARTMEEQATELEASQEQLEDALEFSEGIINAIPDLLFEVDRNGRYLNVWTRTPELLAAQKEMLLGRTVYEVLSPENAAAAMEAIREADEKGASLIKDLCIELPDGKHWFAHSLARKPGHHFAETTFIVLSRDITERKLVEEALATSERNFRSLTENLPDNIARWDTQARYLYINPTHAHTLGVAAGDIVGTELPATHDRVRAAIAQVVATGQAITLVRQPVLVDGEMQIHEVSLAPEYDAEGRIVSVVGLGRDMTEMYRMQEIISAREHELRSLAESSPGMMGSFYLRPDGTVCMPYVSPKIFDLFGLQPQDVFEDASSLMRLNHPDDAQRVLDTIAESARTMMPWHCEFRIQHPTKGERWMESNTSPQPHPDGGTIWYGYVHDITERKRMEKMLAAREQEFRSLAESSPDNIVRFDKEGRYCYLNPRLVKQMGVADVNTLIGHYPCEVWPDGRFAAIDKAAVQAIESDSMQLVDLAVPRANGEMAFSQIYVVPERDATGEIIGTIAFGRDVTAIRETERRLSGLVESLPGIAFTLSVSPEGEMSFPYVSAGVEEIYGITSEAAMGDFSAMHSLIHPDDKPNMEALFAESVRTLTPFRVEMRICPHGRPERWIDVRSDPQVQPDGSILWYGLIFDITARKRAEHAHEETRRRLQSVLKTIPDLVWMKDVDGVYLSCNHEFERFFGAKEAEIIGKTDYDFVDAELADFFRQKDREAIAAERICINEEWVTFADDGRRALLEARKVPVYDENGKIAGVLGVSRDITERKRMEAALKENEARYRYNSNLLQAIIESPSSSVSIYALDREYRFLAFNSRFQKAAKRLWHADIELGMSMLDAIDNEAHREFSRQGFDHVLAGNHGFLESKEERIEDGKTVCEYHDNYGSPIYNDNGEVIGMTVFVLNTTERKEAQQRLELLEQAIDFSTDAIFLINQDLRFTYVNAAACSSLGYSREELLTMGPPDIDPDIDRETALNLMRSSPVGGGVNFETRHRAKDGHTFPVELRGIHFERDGAKFSLSVVRDITERRRMEEKLAVREQEFRALAENSPDTIARYIHGGIRTYINPLFARLSGKPANEMLGVTAADYQATPGALAYHNALLHSLESGEEGECEYTWPAYDGRLITSHIRIVPEYGADGKVASVLAVGRDITERKRMEAALKESEERYRYHFNQLQSMLESSSTVSVFALDREYRYLFFNKRHREGAKRIRGTDIAIGMNMVESIPDKAFGEICRQGFARVLAGNSVFVESEEKVYTDGTLAYEYNDNFGSPIYNDEGEVIGLTVFSINTTERKHLEAELLASRNFLDSVIDSVSDPIFVKDRQHRWTFLNDAFCAFIGRPRDALVGKSDYDFFPKEQADVFWAKDELVFESGEVNLNEESFTSANGEEHHIQTKKTPFISGDGRQMLVGVIRDITELKHYEAAREAALAEAQRLAKLRSEFIAHMSHELRTPLNGILGYAQMLGRDDKLNEKQRVSVDVIRHSGEHLLALIEDILDLARIESGRLKLDIGDIPLIRFLHVVSRIIGVRAKQKNLDFIFELAPDLPQGIRGDEKRLRQVLLNLLSNAVKFTDQGRVTLSVKRVSPSRLAFAVSDTGIGIEPSDREKIFQSFEQVGDAQRRTGGTGLGLSISRQLVRMMGGDIELESHPGDGSTFRFELELPEVDLELAAMRAVSADEPPAAPVGTELPAEPLVAPPQEEMRELRRLALLGNMRDIARYAGHIAGLDPRYRSFAEHLKRLAEGFQSKAILVFVEGYMK